MKTYIKTFDKLSNMELYEILKLREKVFIVEQDCPYVDCDEKDFSSYHLILLCDDEIAAYLRILPAGISYEEASIGRVVVVPEHRGNGFGKKIVSKAIKFSENVLCESKIRISSQVSAVDFYKSFGFDEVGEPYLEDNILHIQMIHDKKTSS